MSHNDSVRVRLLYDLGNYYLIKTEPSKKEGQFSEAFEYFNSALTLSNQLKLQNQYNPKNIICKLGDVSYFQGNADKGYACYKKVINSYMAGKKFEQAGDAYVKLAYSNGQIGNYKESFRFYENARALFAKSKAGNKELNAQVKMAFNYFSMDKLDSAKVTLDRVAEIYKKTNYPALGMVYRGLATCYRYKASYNRALFYAFESEKRTIKAGYLSPLHSIYGEIAQIYQSLGQTDKSIAYYKKTIDLRNKQLIPQQFIFRTGGFLVQQLIKKNRQAEGLQYIEKLERAYSPVGDAARANIAQAKAYCYDALKQYDLAEKSYKDVVDFYSASDTEFYNIALFDISKFFVERKEYNKAVEYLLQLASDTSSVERLKDVQLLLYKVDSAHHNYLPALKHLLKFQNLNDSIFNATKNKQIEELNIKYATDQQLKNISVLQKEAQLQRERVKQADKIKNLMMVSGIILVLFILVLYHNYRLNKITGIEISNKNTTLNQLVTDKEWLLKEIHHRVKNNLQIVMGLLQRQSAYIDNDAALGAIQNSQNRMHSIALIHQKLYQSDDLDRISMPEYIEEMITYLKDSCDIDNRILFEKHIEDIYLDVAQAVPMGLILNEAITNAIKYAYGANNAGVIYVTLVNNNGYYNQLTIADDGAGLPADFNIDKVGSLGINLMRGLTKQLGGSFEIYSDRGCTINIVFKTEILNRNTKNPIN